MTLRELLNHTSGLPDFSAATAFREILQADPHHRFDSRCLLDFVADQPLNFTPGSAYQYSNSDNIAVALMAEAASGRSYEELLDTVVEQPLGLHDTSLPQGFRLPEPYLHGYAVQPPSGAPPGTKNAATITTRARNVVQKESILRTGKAMSSAPI